MIFCYVPNTMISEQERYDQKGTRCEFNELLAESLFKTIAGIVAGALLALTIALFCVYLYRTPTMFRKLCLSLLTNEAKAGFSLASEAW